MLKRGCFVSMGMSLICLLSGCPSGVPAPGFQLVAGVVPTGAGSLVLEPPPRADGTYEPGTRVDVRVEPAGGYAFLEWEGCAEGHAATAEVRMCGDKAVQARFITIEEAALRGTWKVNRGFLYANEWEGEMVSLIRSPEEWETIDGEDDKDGGLFGGWGKRVNEDARLRESYVHFDGRDVALQLNALPIAAEDSWEGRAYNAICFWSWYKTVLADGPYEAADNEGAFIAQLDLAYPPFHGPDMASPYALLVRDMAEAGTPVPEDLNAFADDLLASRYPAALAANQWHYEWEGDTLRMGFSNPGGMTLDELEALHPQIADLPDLTPGAYGYLECTRSDPMPAAHWLKPGAQLEGMWVEPCCPDDWRIEEGETTPLDCSDSFVMMDTFPGAQEVTQRFVWFDIGRVLTEQGSENLLEIVGEFSIDRGACPNRIDVVGDLLESSAATEETVTLAEDAAFLGVFRLDVDTATLQINLGGPNEPRPLLPIAGRTLAFFNTRLF